MLDTGIKRKLESLPESERISIVKEIFSRITTRYDLLNHILSGWRDVYWRKFTVDRIPPKSGQILDVATGTGDLAILCAKRLHNASIKGIDFSNPMIRLAADKTLKQKCKGIDYLLGDALDLPFQDDTFDAAMAAFAFRNIPDRLRAISEMKRVVRSGGKILVLEMTRPRGRLGSTFFKYYLKVIVPAIGGVVSGNREAYKYLSESIEEFMTPDELKDCLSRSGLTEIKAFPLTFGITYLHESRVP